MAVRSKDTGRVVPKVAGRVLVLEARYHEDVSELLIAGASTVLDQGGVRYERITVPGAFEIPGAIKFAINMYDGFVALGCVIRGDTDHYDFVCGEATRGLMTLAIEHNAAIGFGILTVNNHAQAIQRADAAQLDRGGDAAVACLRMLELKRRFLGGTRA